MAGGGSGWLRKTNRVEKEQRGPFAQILPAQEQLGVQRGCWVLIYTRDKAYLKNTRERFFNSLTNTYGHLFDKIKMLKYAPHSAAGLLRVATQPYALRSLQGYINGSWQPAASGRTVSVINPADGTPLASVPDMGAVDTAAAIAAARAAFPSWSQRPVHERSAVLRRVHDALLAHAPSLAVLLSLECGKPVAEAQGELQYAADYFSYYAEEVRRPQGEVLTPSRTDRAMLTSARAVGPVALLTPWNFPAAMPARKLAPALAAGCTVVFRPAIETPLTAMALVQLAEEAGLPPGVLNLVTGADHAATAGVLTASPDIRKLSFTGSTRVGRLLMAQCAPTLKRLSLELGGHAPFIVFEDAGEGLQSAARSYTTALSLLVPPPFLLRTHPPSPPPLLSLAPAQT